jgi:hypothetical protein
MRTFAITLFTLSLALPVAVAADDGRLADVGISQDLVKKAERGRQAVVEPVHGTDGGDDAMAALEVLAT